MAASGLQALAGELQRSGEEYRLCEPPGETEARFECIGRFQAAPVIWEVRLLARGAGEREQFIDIGPARGERRPVTVALALARIDPPAILKTVIMLRNYKRLREGRHVWRV